MNRTSGGPAASAVLAKHTRTTAATRTAWWRNFPPLLLMTHHLRAHSGVVVAEGSRSRPPSALSTARVPGLRPDRERPAVTTRDVLHVADEHGRDRVRPVL